MLGQGRRARARPSGIRTPQDALRTTHLTDRPDSGGNGNWAADDFTRHATITPDGTAPLADCSPTATTCYAYTASLKDDGTFTTINGAFTPNQGGADVGDLITATVTGRMSGYGDFTTFYATTKPSAQFVPQHVERQRMTRSYLWPDLFFPSTATVTGVNEATWGYRLLGDDQDGHQVVHRRAAPPPLHLAHVLPDPALGGQLHRQQR